MEVDSKDVQSSSPTDLEAGKNPAIKESSIIIQIILSRLDLRRILCPLVLSVGPGAS